MKCDNYYEIIDNRGITRLVHFTKSKNLPFILGDYDDVNPGLFANNYINRDGFHVKNDLQRFDGKEDYICTSVQYPNFFYLGKVRNREKENLFNEWVILEINPRVIDETSFFCPVNAAKERGKYITSGIKGFCSLFEDKDDIPRKITERNVKQPSNTPTDLQAEVLVYKRIKKDNIMGIIFSGEKSMKNELLRLKLAGVSLKDIKIKDSNELFDRESYKKVRNGERIKEHVNEVYNG